MLSSVFSNVFVYRQRENNTPLENFLIEIFAFCLSSDVKFRKDFFEQVLELPSNIDDIQISTQEDYGGYGRPDIEVVSGDSIILFECKVEALERKNQLQDYALLLKDLKRRYKNKCIVYLTKYYEHKEIEVNLKVNLYVKRWYSVYEIINMTHSEITQQFKIFLKEEGMEKVKNFTIQDMFAMKTISTTITKMDELLQQFKSEFEKKFGGYSKESSRSSRLCDYCYTNYVMLNYQRKNYWLDIGFFWWWEEEFVEFPQVGLNIQIPVKKFEGSDLMDIFNTELVKKKNWEFEEDEDYYYCAAIKPLTYFIEGDDDNVPAMKKFIHEQLNILYKLKEKYPRLLRKSNNR